MIVITIMICIICRIVLFSAEDPCGVGSGLLLGGGAYLSVASHIIYKESGRGCAPESRIHWRGLFEVWVLS